MVKNTRATLSSFSLAILLLVICGCRGLATYQPPAANSPSSPAGAQPATQWTAGPFSTLNATPYGWDYATFLGGNGAQEVIIAMDRDPAGNIYVGGTTDSADFPVTTGVL